MTATLVDLVRIRVLSTGTGALTLGAAAGAHRGVEALVNGETYSYTIQQGDAYESGTGVYLSAGQQFIRSPVESSNGNGPLDLQPNAELAFVARAIDIQAAKGPKGDTGDPGPAGNTVGTINDLRTNAPTNLSAVVADPDAAGVFFWKTGNFTGQDDGVSIVGSSLDGYPISAGAWIRLVVADSLGTSPSQAPSQRVVNDKFSDVETALTLASAAEAQEGTDTAKLMVPARVKNAIEGMAFADPYGLSQQTTLNSRFQRVYDMRAAGCPNNGTDDDYPTFAALYAQAKAAGGGCILLPNGPLRFNSPVVIDTSCVSVIGAGAGATRWLNPSKTSSFIRLIGADVHSIEIGHIQFEPLSGLPQTNGGVFSFERNGGSSMGAGCLDVKLHHFTTFKAFHGITTAFSAQGTGTPFLDVTAHQFQMRDCVNQGVFVTQSAGFKMDQYTVAFPDPQGTQPAAGSRCIYLGDWVDGFWIGKGNALGGETTFDMGSDWSSNRRKPAQGEIVGLSVDSGWLSSARLRALFNCEFHRMLVGDLADGGGPGLLINGAGSAFDTYQGVDMVKFFGGWCSNNVEAGLNLQGKSRNVYFYGMHFVSNGQKSTTGAYNNAYVAPNMTDWGFFNCVFDVNPWFGTKKAGYALFVDTGCDRYWLRSNSFNAANHYSGGLFNGSSSASNKTIDGNLA